MRSWLAVIEGEERLYQCSSLRAGESQRRTRNVEITTANLLSLQFYSVEPLATAAGNGTLAPQAKALASATKAVAEENFALTSGEPATSPALLLFSDDARPVQASTTGTILDFFV